MKYKLGYCAFTAHMIGLRLYSPYISSPGLIQNLKERKKAKVTEQVEVVKSRN